MLQLNLLGDFSVTKPSGTEVVLRGRRAAALITLTALSPNCEISRDQIISKLWCKRSVEQARASLRTLLSDISGVSVGNNNFLINKNREKNTVYIDNKHVSIDVLQFIEFAKSHTLESRCRVLDVYNCDLLDSFTLNEQNLQDWLTAERNQLRELFRDTLIELLEEYQTLNKHEKVIEVSHRLLRQENTEELAHRALMSVYSEQGNKPAALKQFTQCVEAMQELLGVPPSHETLALHEEIRLSKPESASVNLAFTPSPKLTKPFSTGLSIGVVPFESDAAEMRLVDDVASDIVSALARFKWMAVVPRGTTFSFRGHGMSAVEIGRVLSIQYVVDGNGVSNKNSLALFIELNDVVRESHLWGKKYTLASGDNLDSREILVGKIVSEIEIRLRTNEVRRVLCEKGDSSNAFDCVWKAISHMYELTEASFKAAQEEFEAAEKLDETFAPLYSWWALWEVFCVGQGWPENRRKEVARAYGFARKANRLDPEDALALAIMGHCEAFLYHEFDEALRCFEVSLRLNPNSAFVWMLSSATYSYYGEPDEALRRLEKSEQLCPIEPHFNFMFYTAKAIACTFKGNYRESVRWGRRAVRESPFFSNGYKPLLASLGQLNKTNEAKEYVRRLMEIEPNFCVDKFSKDYPFKNTEDRDRYTEGLIKAGVPKNEKKTEPQIA